VTRTSACFRKRQIPMQVCEECLERHNKDKYTARMGEQLTNDRPLLHCNFWHLSAVFFVRFCVSMQLRLSDGHFRIARMNRHSRTSDQNVWNTFRIFLHALARASLPCGLTPLLFCREHDVLFSATIDTKTGSWCLRNGSRKIMRT